MLEMTTPPTVALITGVTGQGGAYLSELLLDKGYEVHGIKRRASLFNTDRIDHLYQDPHVDHQRFKLHYGDLTDSTNLIRIVQQVQPDAIYNLAAMSHVAVSFETPEYTANADGIGTLRKVEGAMASCKPGDVIVKVDLRYYRPTEVETLLGDASKAKRKLGWDQNHSARTRRRNGHGPLCGCAARQPGQGSRVSGLRPPRMTRIHTVST